MSFIIADRGPGFTAVGCKLGYSFHRVDLILVTRITIDFVEVLALGIMVAHFGP